MIKCRLSTIMGERRLKVSDVATMTGVHRNVITKYYRDEPALLSRDVIDKLCGALGVKPNDLLEYVENQKSEKNS